MNTLQAQSATTRKLVTYLVGDEHRSTWLDVSAALADLVVELNAQNTRLPIAELVRVAHRRAEVLGGAASQSASVVLPARRRSTRTDLATRMTLRVDRCRGDVAKPGSLPPRRASHRALPARQAPPPPRGPTGISLSGR